MTTNFPNGISVSNKGSAIRSKLVEKSLVIPIKFGDGTTETATGFILPTNCIVKPEIVINVRVAEATGGTKTIDFGTDSGDSGDADGFANGVSVAATGLVKTTIVDGGVTLGAKLFVESGTGADVANAPEIDVSQGGKELTWTPGSNDFAELDADIIITYMEIT